MRIEVSLLGYRLFIQHIAAVFIVYKNVILSIDHFWVNLKNFQNDVR